MTQTIPIDWGEAEQFRLAIQHTIDGEHADQTKQQEPHEQPAKNVIQTRPS